MSDEVGSEENEPGERVSQPHDGGLEARLAGARRALVEWVRGGGLPGEGHVLLGLVLPMALAAALMWRLKGYTVDDAYISYRYARNLADGLGLVYNAGERIEGYTNFLWTVLLAGGIKLGLDPVGVAKVLGASFTCLSMVMVYRLSEWVRPFASLPCVATWLLASTAVFTGYGVFGLETPMFSFLVLAGTLLFWQEEERADAATTDTRPGWRRLPWSGGVFALAGLTRPEAPMFLGLLMIFLGGPGLASLRPLVGREPDEGRAPVLALAVAGLVTVTLLDIHALRKGELGFVSILALAVCIALLLMHLPRRMFGGRNWLRGALFVVPVGAHLLWRFSYYGAWLPNTLTAKTGDLGQQVRGGVDYVQQYIAQDSVLLWFVVFGVAAGLVWRHRVLLAFAAVTAVGTLYVVLVGGDWMVLFRFLAPVQPFLYLVIGLGLRALWDERHRVLQVGLVLLAFLAVAERGRAIDAGQKVALGKEKAFWDRAAGGTAAWFQERAGKFGREQVIGDIALGDIGQIGYETNFPIFDLLGLVDAKIAELPGGYTNKTGIGYRDWFFERHPRYFILISAKNDCRNPSVPGSRVLYQDRRFLEQYTLSGRVPLEDGFSWCVYERIDLQPEGGAAPAPASPRGTRGTRRAPPGP